MATTELEFEDEIDDFEGATTEKTTQRTTTQGATKEEEVKLKGALVDHGPTSWYFNGRTWIFKTHLDIVGALRPQVKDMSAASASLCVCVCT